jgi:predicted aspartyl protease
MRRSLLLSALFLVLAASISSPLQGAVSLTALDAFVVSHGYGGAQFVTVENTYRLPIIANGKTGDLTIDTGSPSAVIFKATVKKYGLTTEETKHAVHGAFGEGTEKVALTTIHQLAMGNVTLMNVKAAVFSDYLGTQLYRQYGATDGLFGLREMLKYGAVLDISNHLLLVHPSGGQKGISSGIRSILTKQGYTPINLDVVDGHLRVKAVVNGRPCQLIVDTGAFLTNFQEDFARQAHLGGQGTQFVASALGGKGRPMRMTQFPELKVGDFVIKNASATITSLDPALLGGGKTPAVGLLGAEYLGLYGAVFDFNDGTLYLRPKKK